MTRTNSEPNAVETAKAKIQSIQQAIVGGDKNLTALDLANAKIELEFAELRHEAALENERKADLARRTARAREFEKRLTEIADDNALTSAKKRFEQAFKTYVETAGKHNKALYELQKNLSDEGLQPGGINSEGVSVAVKFPSGSNQPFSIGEAQAFFTDIRKPTHEFIDSNLTNSV
jgi:hypothetical protein